MITPGLEIHFSCAHFYHQRKWSREKNQQVFGKCFTEYGHGHDYKLKAEFPGLTEISGAKAALASLREELDHQHVNHVIPEFRDQIPTTENMLLLCLERLQRHLGRDAAIRLELWETNEIGASLESGTYFATASS